MNERPVNHQSEVLTEQSSIHAHCFANSKLGRVMWFSIDMKTQEGSLKRCVAKIPCMFFQVKSIAGT